MIKTETTWTPRTDLALEIGATLQAQSQTQTIEGIDIQTEKNQEYPITTTSIEIINEQGVKAMGKPIGHYITIESPMMKENDPDAHREIINVVSTQLQKLLPKKEKLNVLVVGLGNRYATPDRLGPDVSGKVLVTRHLKEHAPDAIDESINVVSSLTPGVMGLTGIETSEIIQGVVENTKPDCIIAIDALAARSPERINATIQMSDTGISPGAGIGNRRKQLNEETMGCPVIAIGVPTVIDTATLVNDTFEHLIESMLENAPNHAFYQMLQQVSEEEKYVMIKEILEPKLGNLFVTAKDIDEIMVYLSEIIFNSINIAVHPGIGLDDINKYSN
ncbi:GPR endopeptidase [Niameybacter massiliensis]|uniref:Germination protease n=1 Tax=Holtiella tumoricola TaxID=3018743 RepID=A0AA42DRZ9_9FIRM|nr:MULTISPECIES: GPR endopeptidase [Lachnospirales]MDA3733629.1 GPR endopeptidase [Holtiella tumoricola]